MLIGRQVGVRLLRGSALACHSHWIQIEGRKVTLRTPRPRASFDVAPTCPPSAPHATNLTDTLLPIHSCFTDYVMSLLSSNVVNYLGTFPHTFVRDSPCAVTTPSDPSHSLAIPAGGGLWQCRPAAVTVLDTRPRNAALREERRPAHAHKNPPGWHVLRPAAGRGYKCASGMR